MNATIPKAREMARAAGQANAAGDAKEAARHDGRHADRRWSACSSIPIASADLDRVHPSSTAAPAKNSTGHRLEVS